MHTQTTQKQFQAKTADPPIPKGMIEGLVGSENAERTVTANATNIINEHQQYDQNASAEAQNNLRDILSLKSVERETAQTESKETPAEKEVRIDAPVHENGVYPKSEMMFAGFIGGTGLPTVFYTVMSIAIQSGRFEFLLENPWQAIMFAAVPLGFMWNIAWWHEQKQTPGQKLAYRKKLSQTLGILGIIWIFCFVIASKFADSGDRFAEGFIWAELFFVGQLMSQLAFEILLGGCVKIWLFHLHHSYFKTVSVQIESGIARSESIKKIDEEITDIKSALAYLIKYDATIEAGRNKFVGDCLAYLHKKQDEHNAGLAAAEAQAKAAQAAQSAASAKARAEFITTKSNGVSNGIYS